MINFDTPKFITFEGGEGSGKSTHSCKLYEYLLENNINVIKTRERGGTDIAEKLRNIVVHEKMMNISELLVIMAARYDHIIKVIIPALLNDTSVICDRFLDSTACYQFDESEITMDYIYNLHTHLMNVHLKKYFEQNYVINNTSKKRLHAIAQNGILPDITFFMDLPPAFGLDRAISRGDVNKFEAKSLKYHTKIYNAFKDVAKLYPKRVKTIDCQNKDMEEIHTNILSFINL